MPNLFAKSFDEDLNQKDDPLFLYNKSLFVAMEDVPNARIARYWAPGVAINAHPGDDSQAMQFALAENCRFYRLKVLGGAVGDYIKVVEDAPNGTIEALQLDDPTSSLVTNVTHNRVFTSNPATETQYEQGWTEWKRLSQDPELPPLRRLGFEASTNALDYIILMEGF